MFMIFFEVIFLHPTSTKSRILEVGFELSMQNCIFSKLERSGGQKNGPQISKNQKSWPNFGRRYVWATDRSCFLVFLCFTLAFLCCFLVGFLQEKDFQKYPPNIAWIHQKPSLADFLCFDLYLFRKINKSEQDLKAISIWVQNAFVKDPSIRPYVCSPKLR